ncbi:AAA family ATPase [Vibrio renipiscarius]|uniref:AAA family ATPase n=1 Tax=Vibrio renipiscarius TaxID=1461322 RepID=UPI00355087D8
MLTRSIAFNKVLNDKKLDIFLKEYYNFFSERNRYKGYSYEQDYWENLAEYKMLIDDVQKYRDLYTAAFHHQCPMCLSRINANNSRLIFAHPLGLNKECLKFILHPKNIMPLCFECLGNYRVTYGRSRIKTVNTIYDLTAKIPNIVIPHLESSLTHFTIGDDGDIHLSERFINTAKAFYAPIINDFEDVVFRIGYRNITLANIYFDLARSYFDINSTDNDYDYAVFVRQECRGFESRLISKNKVRGHEIYFSPIKFRYKNLRELRNGELDFSNSSYICILGENGVGKTTLLNSIHASINSDKNKLYYKNDYCFRKNNELMLSFEFINEGIYRKKIMEKTEHDITRIDDFDDKNRAHRRDLAVITLDDKRNTHGRHERDLEWLFEQPNRVFSEVAVIIKDFLSIEEATLYRRGSSIYFDLNGKLNNLAKLSSGYKSIISLIISIYKELYNQRHNVTGIGKFRLVALIDEIELHLHPKWKTTIVQKLFNNFSDVFFIITTHDPLVIKQCSEDYCYKIQKNQSGKSELNKVIDFSEYDIDMILSSPIFEVESKSSIDDRLKGETLRSYYARKIVNESIRKYKKISSEELAIRLEMAIRDEKDRTPKK